MVQAATRMLRQFRNVSGWTDAFINYIIIFSRRHPEFTVGMLK